MPGLAAARVAAAGDALLAPSITRRLIGEFARQSAREAPPDLADLTPGEVEVLTLIARGLSNAERLTALLDTPFELRGRPVRVAASIGVAVHEPGQDAEALLRRPTGRCMPPSGRRA